MPSTADPFLADVMPAQAGTHASWWRGSPPPRGWRTNLSGARV